MSLSQRPEPTLAKLPNIWTLDVTFEQPQQICVKLGGDLRPYAFLVYDFDADQSDGQDVPFYPDIWLVTDTFQRVQASTNAREKVFDKIYAIWKGRYPFLEPFEFVGDKILQGSDNTKDLA